MDTPDLKLPNDIRVEELHKGKWISFNQQHFTDPNNQSHTWEYVSRTTRNSTVDAVEVLGILNRKGKKNQIITVLQYRPPTKSFCLEFPAGLKDAGETVQEAAERELFEETGYRASKWFPSSPQLFYEPGLSDTNMIQMICHIDGDLECNVYPDPKREADEWSLETILFDLDETLLERLKELSKKENIVIDAKLYAFGMGLLIKHFE